jgi:hypothetical protein
MVKLLTKSGHRLVPRPAVRVLPAVPDRPGPTALDLPLWTYPFQSKPHT